MVETITATYKHENDDWTITVSGRGKELTGKAPGIIAARDRADQLVEKIAPNERPTVVHLLNGNALEFTSTYMAARLTLPEIEPLEIPPSRSGSGSASGTASKTDKDAKTEPEPKAEAKDAAAGSSATGPGPGTAAAGSASGIATAGSASGAASAASDKADATKPALPPSKQLPKAVEDRKPGEANRPGVTAGASATPPAARA
ncbi:hypothetical protein [Amycolatopsis jejuensis]|uniref:hypothetical protein n=1 Tax=Amycolatopsis jejuensis TaxID=330084 RepID=UPI000525D9E4|nr:hypothetical protein [Amycolatopsis jejuensis]